MPDSKPVASKTIMCISSLDELLSEAQSEVAGIESNSPEYAQAEYAIVFDRESVIEILIEFPKAPAHFALKIDAVFDE